MSIYVSKQEMDAADPAIWEAMPPGIRDRLPAHLTASSLNTVVLRDGFTLLRTFLDKLFVRLEYEEGTPWLQWKLLAAFYLIQAEVGPETLYKVGRRIYGTMPWPPTVSGVADAIDSLEGAFRAAHHDAPPSLIGGWRATRIAPGKILVESSTLYPCHLEEGTIAGICDAFAAERPTLRLVETVLPRRSGGDATCIEVCYRPRDDAYQTAPASSHGPCRTHNNDTAP